MSADAEYNGPGSSRRCIWKTRYCVRNAGTGMQILSFITDPPVVDKILRHIKWYPGEPILVLA